MKFFKTIHFKNLNNKKFAMQLFFTEATNPLPGVV